MSDRALRDCIEDILWLTEEHRFGGAGISLLRALRIASIQGRVSRTQLYQELAPSMIETRRTYRRLGVRPNGAPRRWAHAWNIGLRKLLRDVCRMEGD